MWTILLASREIASVEVMRPRGRLNHVHKPYITAFVDEGLQCSPGLATRRLYGPSRIKQSWCTKNDAQYLIFEKNHRPSEQLMTDEVNFESTVSVNEQNKILRSFTTDFHTVGVQHCARFSTTSFTIQRLLTTLVSEVFLWSFCLYIMQIFSLSMKLFSDLK